MKKKYSVENKKYFSFNIWDFNSAFVAIDAAAEMRRDIMLQTSVKTFNVINNKKNFNLTIKEYARSKNIRAIIHLDHCKDLKLIEQAISYQWDSVLFDGSHLPLEENISQTNIVCEIAKKTGALIEAEIGVILGVEEDIVHYETVFNPAKDIIHFAKSVQADMIAFDMGTAHGVYTDEPRIEFDKLATVSNAIRQPIVVHGGSGLSNEMLKKFFSYRVCKINVSTELKMAYHEGIQNVSANAAQNTVFEPLIANVQLYKPLKKAIKSKFAILE